MYVTDLSTYMYLNLDKLSNKAVYLFLEDIKYTFSSDSPESINIKEILIDGTIKSNGTALSIEECDATLTLIINNEEIYDQIYDLFVNLT